MLHNVDRASEENNKSVWDYFFYFCQGYFCIQHSSAREKGRIDGVHPGVKKCSGSNMNSMCQFTIYDHC